MARMMLIAQVHYAVCFCVRRSAMRFQRPHEQGSLDFEVSSTHIFNTHTVTHTPHCFHAAAKFPCHVNCLFEVFEHSDSHSSAL